ncbi:MAG TPA: ABC transporter permease [Anaeromyxobacteraceae bacterium]|nr:ABC transporter permease [Anaeromyxobacteraceae bacterium]
MPFEWFVAMRYLREGRAQTALVLGGTTMGVAVLVFLTALISGLQRSLVAQTLSSQAHILVKAPERVARPLALEAGLAADRVQRTPDRIRSVEQWQQVLEAVARMPGVVAATPTAAGSAFASRGEASKPVAVRGVDDETFARVIEIGPKIRAGRFRLDGTSAVIGSVLADDLGIAVGDKLRLATPEGRGDTFVVEGIFDLGNRDVNQRWVLVPLRSAQAILDLPGGATTIEVRVADVFAAERIARQIERDHGLGADSWMKLNEQLLVALRSQSASSYLIQALVVVAVALGIASVLGVSVIQKSREIGILRATGTSTRRIQRIFLLEGAVVGAAGSVFGGLVGTSFAVAFANLAKSPTGEPVFPVDLTPGLFLAAFAIAIATGTLAAWFPASRAARLDPAEVIRYG